MLAILMVAVLSVGFVSCGDDDDDDAPRSANQLIGTWIETYFYETVYEKSNGNWVKIREYEGEALVGNQSFGMMFQLGGIVRFIRGIKSDGTYSSVESEFGYKLQNGHLYLRELDEADTDGWEEYGKISISGDTFELSWEEISGNKKNVGKDIYKKIK